MESMTTPQTGTVEDIPPIGAHRALARVRSLIATFLPRSAIVLSLLTFAGYAMGVVRDRAFARTYGAGASLDAYNAAFVLPELALDVLVAGGLIAPFVPLFTGLRDKAAGDALAFGRTVLTYAIVLMAVVCVVLFIFAPQTVDLIVPGFQGDQRDLYVSLFRLMCVTPVVFAISIVLGEILVAEQRFVWYGLAALMYNGGIAAGTLLLSDQVGIYGAAIGALVGSFLHLGIRLVGILRATSFRPRPRFDLRTKGFGEFSRLMVPKMVSQPIEPLTFLYFTALASTLEPGSVSSVSFARNFEGVPVSLIGMSFAIAAFPTLAARFNEGDRRGFMRTFATNFASIAVITTVGSVVLFFISTLVIKLVLGGGAFDEVAVARTAGVLSVFAFAIPLESLTNLLSRALYATHNTLLPTIASVAGFVMTVVVAQALAPTLGLTAIPAAYAAGMGLKVGLTAAALIPRMASIGRSRPAGPAVPFPRRIAGRMVAVVLLLIVSGGAIYAADQAIGSGASLVAVPAVTPWARTDPLPTPSPVPSSLPVVVGPSVSAHPSPTPKPGPFSMDLYQTGDYVGELEDIWCVPAAMQTSMNIMDVGADTTRATQARLYALATTLYPPQKGGAEPEGWALGLTSLGYGNYEVNVQPTLKAAVHLAAKQVRLTNRPAGLVVWYGAHSWVMSGFTASADPALTDAFTVTAVRIEDVWYPRFSTIWGYSRPPDTNVAVTALPRDFLPWRMPGSYPDKAYQYVIVIPTL
jgi:putative peptidoglycan lipid II flippase